MGALATHSQLNPRAIGRAVVPLLALSVFINYVDRGNLATAAPLMKDELHLSGTEMGVLLSAFYWSYVPAQIAAGWLAERLNPYRTLAIGAALWSLATAGTGLTSGFTALLTLRLILGLGESAAFPCSSKLLTHHLPLDRLGSANGLIATGQALGPAFGTFIGGLLIARYEWRTVFILFGVVSLLWLVPWTVSTRRISAHTDRQPKESGPSFAALMRRPELWVLSAGQLGAAYAFYFVISWLPLYFVKSRGLSVAQMAELGGLIYLVYAASSFLVGGLTDRWIRAGARINRARKSAMILGHIIIAVSLAAAAIGNLKVSVISLFSAGFAFGLTLPNFLAIGQTLAGPRAAGKWVGIQNSMGNLAGILAPIITGLVIDRTGQYYWGFIIAASLAAAGIVAWVFFMPKVKPIDWGAPARPPEGHEVPLRP